MTILQNEPRYVCEVFFTKLSLRTSLWSASEKQGRYVLIKNAYLLKKPYLQLKAIYTNSYQRYSEIRFHKTHNKSPDTISSVSFFSLLPEAVFNFYFHV